jgi:hypothetical protein
LFDLSDSEPELRVSYATGIANAIRDFFASGPDRFEMQHVFAFRPIEPALVAVSHERESLFNEGNYDNELPFVFTTPASHDVSGLQLNVYRHYIHLALRTG